MKFNNHQSKNNTASHLRVWWFLLLLCASLTGCMSGARIQGGKTSYVSGNGAAISMTQSQDPKTPSTLKTEIQTTKEYVVPAGSKVYTGFTNGFVLLSSNMPVRTLTVEKIDTNQGAAQENTLGATIAKLKSMAPVQFVGIALLLFGIASMVYPPLRLIIASVTTSIVIAATGMGLIVLPILIVGNELIILLGGLGIAVGYLFIHRFGKASGENKVLKQWVDANGDGIKQDSELK